MYYVIFYKNIKERMVSTEKYTYEKAQSFVVNAEEYLGPGYTFIIVKAVY